ncbi:MAG: anti-sigma factor [Bradymonadaceae bacterium]|nr:anti-sigma factor [Lujinxingiaceae bacterium]
MMTCKEATDQVTDYLDGRVPHGKRIGIWLHLMMCVRCRSYVNQMRQVVELIGDLSKQPLTTAPPDVRDALMAEFRRRKNAPADGPGHVEDGEDAEDAEDER